MKCDEIFAALAMLEKERGISQSFMMEKIVQALTTAYKRDHEGVENVVVDVDEGKRELKMFVQKEVVEEVENPGTQMSLDDAKAISAKYNVGDIVNIPVDNIEFGRIAAGNGKQVIIQGLREAESGMVYDEYNSKQHEILTGVVTRIDPRTGNASLRIGTGTEATDALLLAGKNVPVRMVPLSHPHAASFTLLGFQRIIDRERRNIRADGTSGHAQFQRETAHGFLSPRCHDAHDFSAALVCRHGRSPLFLGSG